MKTTLLVLLVITFLGITSSSSNGDGKCEHQPLKIDKEWMTMTKNCTNKMRDQVQVELGAAMTYLAMGAHFSKYDVNRPGFAKYFFESASEEREHAIKIISYLLMRTDPADYLDELIKNPSVQKTAWTDGAAALEDALKLETSVTVNIRDIIAVCEDKEFNDYHLVDYLSGDFLEEQYKGQRQLAGMISTLQKMRHTQGVLGEYLFDKKLLNNELF